jgi:serine/threonine protein kinase
VNAERTEHNMSSAFAPPSSGGAPPDALLIERVQAMLGAEYEVQGVLGDGPVGIVFKVRDRASRETVALKLLAGDPDSAAAALENAGRVAQVAKLIAHPRVVAPRAVQHVGHAVFYTMPLFEGGSLERAAARGPLSIGRILEIVTEVAAVLDHAHARRIVHGGVKPSNILFDRDGRVHLADFGVDEFFKSALTIRGRRVRAAGAYTAPEQWRGLALDPRADQYSLAVIAYELLTGERRVDAANVEGIAVLEPLEVSTYVELRRGAGKHLNEALRKALSASGANRFATVSEFADALAGRVRVPGTQFLVEPERPFALGRAHVAAAAAVVAILAGALALFDPVLQRRVVSDLRGIRRSVDPTNPSFELSLPSLPRGRVSAGDPGGGGIGYRPAGSSGSGTNSEPSGSGPFSSGSGTSSGPARGASGRTGAPPASGNATARPYSSGSGATSPDALGRVGRTGGAGASSSAAAPSSPGGGSTAGHTSRLRGNVEARSAGFSSVGEIASAAASSLGRLFDRIAGRSSDAPRKASPGAPVDLSPPAGTLSSVRAASGDAEPPRGRRAATRGGAAIEVNTVGGLAVVLVDGVPRGSSPTIIRVSPGWHSVEVRSPGARYTPARRQVSVSSRDTVVLEFMRVAAPR